MKITSFNPVIMTTDKPGAIKLFEGLGFSRKHTKNGLDEREDIVSVRMENEGGFHVDIVETKNIKQDAVGIRMNVDDFDAAVEFLQSRGFRPTTKDPVVDATSKSFGMLSPTGYQIGLVHHIKK